MSETLLWDLLRGPMTTRALALTAELRIADELADGPRPVAELAESTGADRDTLYRTLRALASDGVFAEDEPGVFRNTDASELLRRDGWTEFAHLFGSVFYDALRGFPQRFEHDFWEWLAAHPAERDAFDTAMSGGKERQAERLAALEWEGVETVVDVGGGNGELLRGLLRRRPELRGIVFDLPQVVPGAANVLAEAGVDDRAELVGGDYFASVPAGGDVYVISHVSHQLSDEEAITVLRNVREAMDPEGRVVIIDPVLPEGDTPHPGKFMDITMMTLTHGGDRTEAELAALLRSASLRLVRTVALSAPSSVVVAVPS